MVMQTMPVSAIAEVVEQEQQDQQLLAEVQSANEGSTTNVGEGDNTGSNGNATNDFTSQGDATPDSDTSDSSPIDDSGKTDVATAPAANAADSTDADSTGVVDASNFDSPNAKLVAPPAQSEQALAAQASPSALRAAKKQDKQEPQTNNQNPISGDDQRIENITVAWATPDDAKDNSPARLSLVPKTDEFSVKMKLSVALSGQYSYKEGEIQIVVPKYIFADRDGKPAGELEAAVPEAPSQQSTFAYTEMGDSYVLSNTCELSAATQASFEFAVRKLDPIELVGNGQLKDGEKAPAADALSTEVEKYVTDNFYGTVNLTTHAGNVLSMTSNKLDASVDTQEVISGAELRGQSLSEDWPSNWPEELKPADADKYIYIDWYSWTSARGKQKYVLQGSTDGGDSGYKAKLLGVSYNGKTVGNKGDDATQNIRFTAENSLDYVSFNNSTGYLHTYMAYPKDQFELGGHYKLKHKVGYTLTSADDHEVTSAPATAQLTYSPIKFQDPHGHFNVFKYSNGSYSSKRGKCDNYPYVLDSLRLGRDAVCSYDVETVGFTGPWTTDKGGKTDYNQFLAGDYGKHAVRMETPDYSVRFDHTDDDLTADDFEFEGVSVDKPTVYGYQRYTQTGYGYYEGSDGAVRYDSIGAGNYGYVVDGDNAKQPDIEIWGSVKSGTEEGDNWVRYGTVSYRSGAVAVEPQNGASASADGTRLLFPKDAGVTDIKTCLSTKTAGVTYTMHPYVRLKPTERIRARVDQLFKDSDTPETILRNTAKSYNYDYKGNLIVECGPKSDDDFLTGAASGISMDKRVKYDTDKDGQTTTLHYTANVYEQTNLTTLSDYNEAAAAGVFTPDMAGTFYDLLPKGVEPKLGTVKLNGDNAVESVGLKRNYKGTGRTLMTVKARVAPNPEYRSRWSAGNQPYDGYGDKITLTFDAVYSFDTERDYGSTLVNNIAYESAEPRWGTIAGYKGEPDNPLAGNNQASKDAVKGVEDAMTDLDPESDNSSFVYARVSVKLDHLSWSVAQLDKKVDTNDEGAWSSGLDKGGARNVFENGVYSYRISLNNPDNSSAKDIRFFDAVDAFDPASKTIQGDKPDAGDVMWKGHLLSVDVSALERAGADPHVYYSTVPADQLTLDSESKEAQADLKDRSIWTPAESYEGSLDDVTAVAVDATKKTDGSDFVVDEGDTAAFTIRMRAPEVKDFEQDPAAYGKWFDTALTEGESESGLTGGAHAYNNAILRCTTISNVGVESPNQVIRKDYTKVGLKPFGITIKKAWSDSDDQDGKRPQSVTVHLYADGQDTGKSAVLSDANNWQASFGSDDGLCVLNDEGDTIAYSVKEETPEGYLADVRMNPTDTGYEFTVTNKHRVETVEIAGRKIWDDANDAAGKRPKEVKIDLYADGELVKSKTVKAADSGDWNYSFGSLPKYRDHGIEIAYEVREDTYYEGYVTSVAGTDVTNTYNPYGTLKISKAVQDATDVSAQKEFSFKLTLTTPEGEPEGGTFAYTVTDAAGAQVATGTVGNGDTIKLRGGQTATITGIPSETTYKVTEAKAAGFRKTDSTGATGTIRAGEERAATASFTNTYNAAGKAYLKATKVLEGRKLKAKQFTFDVLDEAGNTVVTARNGADGAVNFGAIKYGLADVGKTYTYYIIERNTEAKGYTYSNVKAKATVSVTDNGDGTLKSEVSYDGGEASTFTNEYHASGTVDLKAWKTLEGRDLKDNEFNFKLEKLTGEGVGEQAEEVGTAANSADGKIVFSHESIQALRFTEADAGKTYRFRVSEVVPAGEDADSTVDYDSQSSFIYAVKVVDNGDSTLGFDVSSDAKPVFKNKLKDGKLCIAKTMEGDNPDPNKEFTFRVQLTGKNLPKDGKYDFTRKAYTGKGDAADEAATTAAQSSEPPADETVQNADSESKNSNAANTGGASACSPSLSAALAANVTPATAEQAADVPSSAAETFGSRAVTVAAAGESLSAKAPNIMSWYGGIQNGLYTDKVITLPEASVHGKVKDNESDAKINYDLYADGTMRVHSGTFAWNDLMKLAGEKKAKYLELENGCTASSCTYHGYGVTSLVSIVGYLNTADDSDMNKMLYGCKNLKSLCLTGFDTSNVTNMGHMFHGCSGLTSLDLSGLDTSSVTYMGYMFYYCPGLTSLDVSGLDTSSVMYMDYMFYGCSGLTSLDLSHLDTSKVRYALNMFSLCKTLNEVVVGEKSKLRPASKFGSSYDHSLFTDTWVRDEDGAKLTSSQLADGVAHPGTWRRMPIDFSYTVNYAAGPDDVTGEMASVTSKEGDTFTFPKCMFYSLNYEFVGWKVTGDNLSGADPSKIYQPGDAVEGGISHRGGTATLTAQWRPIDNSVDIKDGAFDITLRAGEAGVIDGLPAGTGYNVYEKTPAGYKLVSSSDTSGTIDPAETKTAVFTNGYAPDEHSTSATIAALKTLDGEPAAGDTFSFTLAAEGGAPMPEGAAGGSLTVANGAGGAVNFGSITYDRAGTYIYTISEVEPEGAVDHVKDGITYDGTPRNVTVKVTAADDGSLSADVTYDGKSSLPVFANKTKTVEPRYGSLTFTKKVEGAPVSDAGRKFKFRVDWDSARDGEEFALAAGESKTWTGLEPGLGYTITELDVRVGYKASGAVTGSIEADKQSRESITNTYTVKPKGSFTVSAKKKLEGRELKAGEFTFELVEVEADDSDGDVVATATNDADGKISFGKVELKGAGERSYRIREVKGSERGVAYDTAARDLTVKATDNGDGTLKCDVSYEGGSAPTFTNTYKAPEGSFTAKAIKKLDGRKLTADDKFSFDLLKVKADGSDGDVVATAENDADGNVTFPSVTVASAGEHRYRIREKAGSAAGITYDKRAYDLTVTARASQADDSKLECTVAYIGTDAAAEPPVFTNSYEAKGTFAAHATKSVEGADLKKDAYTFELLEVETDGSDGEVVATAKNDAEGNVTFGEVTVTSLGEHRYRMREVAGAEPGMAYDTAARDLTVTATDAGNGKLKCEVAYEGGAEPGFVNVFQKPGTFVARAYKALDGRKLEKDEFEFELVKVKDDGSDGKVVATAKNDAEGNVVFGKLSVDAKGRYKYRIREKAGKDGSVIYDKNEYDLDVVATDDTDGNLSCQVVYVTSDHVVPTFTNNIKTPEGSFKVEATKKLEGRKLKDGEFTFELVEVEADDSDGDVVATATNDADGKISFGKVELKGAGERSYRIREVKGSERGVAYDTAARDLTVKATDNGDGTLKCDVSYEGGSAPMFTNKYTAPKGSFKVEASKVLEGRKLKAGEFEFELVKVKADGSLGKVVAPAKNGADGKVEFPAVELTGEGTRSYRIREVKGDASGVTYDGKSYGLTVDARMSEGDDAKLDCTVSYDGGSAPTFTNAYGAEGGFKVSASKKLEGRELKAGEFSFELVDADGKVVATAKNGADGKVEFPAVELKGAGERSYRIREAKGDKPGVSYDGNEYGLTVKATDNGDGTLKCVVSYEGGSAPTLTNAYVAKGSFRAQATKVLDGRDLKDKEFSFELVKVEADGSDGKVVATAKNGADGKVSFPEVALDAAGTYGYRIREVKGDKPGVSYDGNEYGLTVAATDNGDGTLSCAVSYDGGSAPTFTNAYVAKGGFKAEATKVLEGRDLKAGEFSFELVDKDGKVVATAKNGADGKVSFDEVKLAAAGEYRYAIREAKGDKPGVAYDGNEYGLTVKATDNGDGTLGCDVSYDGGEAPTLTNKYEAPKGSLTFTKKVEGVPVSDAGRKFKLRVDWDSARDGEEFALAAGESKTWENLDPGLGYTITELDVPAGYKASGAVTGSIEADKQSRESITNVYTAKPEGVFVARATKTLKGRKLKDREFTFELVKVKSDGSDGKVVASAENDAAGNVTFPGVTVTSAGEHRYRIREAKGSESGITYDAGEHEVIVKAVPTDDPAKLSCTVSYADGGILNASPKFENTYTAPTGSFKAGAKKTLDGRGLKEGEFEFELLKVKADGSDGKVVATAKNGADGKVSFPEVELSSAGEYRYCIREKAGSKPGIIYDTAAHGLTVMAVDNGDGKLECTVSYDGGEAPTFTNRYEARGSFKAEATKVLEGRDLKAGEFSFELVDKDGKVVATAENGADGKVEFPEVELTAAGIYAYGIREVAGDDSDMVYDTAVRNLTVTATDSGDGTLKCEVAYEGGVAAEFVNVLRKPGTFVARAHKVLNGRELKAGEFGFELVGLGDDGPEGEVLATAENDAAGNVVFPAVEVASAGTYRYRVREKAGSESGVTYDIATYDLTVTAVDNGDGTLACSIAYANESEPQFVNTYAPPTNPPANPPSTTTTTQTTTVHKRKRGTMPSTGDDTWALACGVALAGSATCALGIASRRRKRR